MVCRTIFPFGQGKTIVYASRDTIKAVCRGLLEKGKSNRANLRDGRTKVKGYGYTPRKSCSGAGNRVNLGVYGSIPVAEGLELTPKLRDLVKTGMDKKGWGIIRLAQKAKLPRWTVARIVNHYGSARYCKKENFNKLKKVLGVT